MSLNIKPLSDRVLIAPVAAETKTASGIFIPDTAKEKPQKGTVIAVGNGTMLEPS
jgi:chaperonin GroES